MIFPISLTEILYTAFLDLTNDGVFLGITGWCTVHTLSFQILLYFWAHLVITFGHFTKKGGKKENIICVIYKLFYSWGLKISHYLKTVYLNHTYTHSLPVCVYLH